jgi:UPF0271 protein
MDLNVDLGELPDEPEELFDVATQVNVACGGHAGDDTSMLRAARLAARSGAALAAHPSYPDRDGFGRRTIAIEPSALAASLREQCARLAAAARVAGVPVVAVKPHGALYHDANRDPSLASAFADAAVGALGAAIAIVGPPRGELSHVALERKLALLREGFADRGYRADGTLVPRSEPGALVLDPALAAQQAVRLAASGEIDTLCLHADTPGVVDRARAVRAALEAAGYLTRRTARP